MQKKSGRAPQSPTVTQAGELISFRKSGRRPYKTSDRTLESAAGFMDRVSLAVQAFCAGLRTGEVVTQSSTEPSSPSTTEWCGRSVS
jgi:hypothetical protein